MVQQCKDCKLWFRTEAKFQNHKEGDLGFSCSGSSSLDVSKKSQDDNPVLNNSDKKKEATIQEELMDDNEISEDEEEIKSNTKIVNTSENNKECSIQKLDDFMDNIEISDDEEESDVSDSKIVIDDSISEDEEEENNPSSTEVLTAVTEKVGISSPSKIVAPQTIEQEKILIDDSISDGEEAASNETLASASSNAHVNNNSNEPDSMISASNTESEIALESETEGKTSNEEEGASIEEDKNFLSDAAEKIQEAASFYQQSIETQTKPAVEVNEEKNDLSNNFNSQDSANRDQGTDTVDSTEKHSEQIEKESSIHSAPIIETSLVDEGPSPKDNPTIFRETSTDTVTSTTSQHAASISTPSNTALKGPDAKMSENKLPSLSLTLTQAIKPGAKSCENGLDTENVTIQSDPKTTTPEVQSNNVSSSSKVTTAVNNDDSIMLSDDEKSEDEDYLESKSNVEQSKTSSEGFTLICLHLDTFKVSSEASFTMSQLGCTTALTGDKEETFFTPIQPPNLQHYLHNYKMEGDLLKALHVTESDNGKFEFRAQFEIKRKEKNKVYCSSEDEAVKNMKEFLSKHQNVILFAIDKDTIENFMMKMNFGDNNPVKGFLTWTSVLKFTKQCLGDKVNEQELEDLEDYYSEHCGKVSGYINALDVSTFLRKSIKKLFGDQARQLSSKNGSDVKFSWHEMFKTVVENVVSLNDPSPSVTDSGDSRISVEVYSSFRPSVSTKISLEKMETLDLSSGSDKNDSELDILEEKVVAKPKPKQSKDLLRQKLTKQFEMLKNRRRDAPLQNFSVVNSANNMRKRLRTEPTGQHPMEMRKRRRGSLPPVADAPIVLSSSDDDTDEETVDHRQVVRELQRRKSLNVTPINVNSDHQNRSSRFVPHCTICNVEFGSGEGLRTHMEQIHLRCNLCNLQFSILAMAVAHKRVHEQQQAALPLPLPSPAVFLDMLNSPAAAENLLQEDNDTFIEC